MHCYIKHIWFVFQDKKDNKKAEGLRHTVTVCHNRTMSVVRRYWWMVKYTDPSFVLLMMSLHTHGHGNFIAVTAHSSNELPFA